MIAALQKLEPLTAIGVLARAAFSLDWDENPVAKMRLPNESIVRKAIFEEVRGNLGFAADDESPKALELLGDAIDEELTQLAGTTDNDEVLRKLAVKGEVPADLYQPVLLPVLRQVYEDHWYLAQDNIFDTIRRADQEQHFETAGSAGGTPLISLFTKEFLGKDPRNNFTMLVAAARDGLKLEVHQAWRIYHEDVFLAGASDLVDILKRFSDVFGLEFSFKGKRAKFMLEVELDETAEYSAKIEIIFPITTDSKGRRKQRDSNFTLSHFVGKRANGTANAALTVAIDLNKYLATLVAHKWAVV